MSLPRRLGATLVLAAVAAAITGCSQTVTMSPAAHADDPACADMMTRLSDTLADQERVWTDAQSTAAWGSPATILMVCGVEEPAVSDLPCTSIAGFDWLVDESDENWYRVTTFGRSPAVQLGISTTAYVDKASVLDRISKTMSDFTRTNECIEKTTH